MTPQHQIEPLDADLWFAELEKLHARRLRLDGEAPDALFRKAFYLVQLAPLELRSLLCDRVPEQTMEDFLDCGAYLSAAASLFVEPTGLSLVRQPGVGTYTAAISFGSSADRSLRASAQDRDEDPAKALLGAWCRAVLSLRDVCLAGDPQLGDYGEDLSRRNAHSTRH